MRRLSNNERKALTDFLHDARREAEATGEPYWGSFLIGQVEELFALPPTEVVLVEIPKEITDLYWGRVNL